MDVFDLQAKISLNTKEYEKNLGDAKSKFSGFADGLKSAAGAIGDVLAGIGKTAVAGIGAAGTALTALTKQSLSAVGSYEQLVGGVDTLFKDASQKVQDYANQAYLTAGLSANEYMETTIQFSASLIQGLKGDTEQAAEIANTAITDMADNVNKMGTTMEAVQNAYRGLSRQNFMMLDNLALGYQGTASEMARLINDSKVMGDTFVATADNVKEISFDKYIEAIHKIQQEMGITGTTSEEAAKTITGSVASMKAAWQNFLTGTGSAKQFTEVLTTSFGNIKKNLKDIIPRLTTGITELVDLLAPEIPPIIEEFLPVIIDGSSKLLTGLAKRMPELLTAMLPSLAEGVVDVSTALVSVMPELITSVKQTIPIIVQTIMSKKDDILKAGKDIIDALIPDNFGNLPVIITGATGFITSFLAKLTDAKNLTAINDKAFELIDAIINGLTSQTALEKFTDEEHGVFKIVENLGVGLVHFASHILDSLGTFLDNFVEFLSNPDNIERIQKGAMDIVNHIGQGLTSEEAKMALGHFLVSFCQFVGSSIAAGGGANNAIDWEYDVGGEIAWKIVKGIWNSTWFGKLGNWLGGVSEDLSDWVHQMDLEYLNEDTNKSYTQYKQERIEEGNSAAYEAVTGKFDPSTLTGLARDAYNNSRHASGFYANRPTWLRNAVVGEAGDEVLLPLDTNTSWMDKLADKLGDRMGGGNIYITVNAPSGNADDIVAAMDEALRNRQIAQSRSTGGTGWK